MTTALLAHAGHIEHDWPLLLIVLASLLHLAAFVFSRSAAHKKQLIWVHAVGAIALGAGIVLFAGRA
jgi:hypothetical protein